MTLATPTRLPGPGAMVPQPWLKETLQAFFAGVAWHGQATPVPEATVASQPQAAGSMLTLPVRQFFDTLPWDGQPTIGVPIAPIAAQPETAPQDESLTLDGFSDLFG
jgi:hypothetical protein